MQEAQRDDDGSAVMGIKAFIATSDRYARDETWAQEVRGSGAFGSLVTEGRTRAERRHSVKRKTMQNVLERTQACV